MRAQVSTFLQLCTTLFVTVKSISRKPTLLSKKLFDLCFRTNKIARRFPLLHQNTKNKETPDDPIRIQNECNSIVEEVESFRKLPGDLASQTTKGLKSVSNRYSSKEALPLIFNPTINQQIKNLMLFKNDQGVPYSKVWKGHHVVPANPAAAKKLIESSEFAMKDNPYTK